MLNGFCSKSEEDSCSLLLSLVIQFLSLSSSLHFLVNASLASPVGVIMGLSACPLQIFTSVPEKVFLFLLFINILLLLMFILMALKCNLAVHFGNNVC